MTNHIDTFETFDDDWSLSDIRDLIETTPVIFDADGMPLGYDAEQLFGDDATAIVCRYQ